LKESRGVDYLEVLNAMDSRHSQDKTKLKGLSPEIFAVAKRKANKSDSKFLLEVLKEVARMIAEGMYTRCFRYSSQGHKW
jgi:hypothetical protein